MRSSDDLELVGLVMIAGHEDVSDGAIILKGEDLSHLPPASRRTSMMFQNYALFPHLTVVENVAFSLKMQGIDKAAREKTAGELLELVDMSAFADRLPDQLSGGQQQRVALARALITKPSASWASLLSMSPTGRTRLWLWPMRWSS